MLKEEIGWLKMVFGVLVAVEWVNRAAYGRIQELEDV